MEIINNHIKKIKTIFGIEKNTIKEKLQKTSLRSLNQSKNYI